MTHYENIRHHDSTKNALSDNVSIIVLDNYAMSQTNKVDAKFLKKDHERGER